jgi:hypothetical protein
MTIRIRMLCNGPHGCGKTSEIDYRILESSYNRMMANDEHLEKTTIFGDIICPICGDTYGYKPSKLKSLIIQ